MAKLSVSDAMLRQTFCIQRTTSKNDRYTLEWNREGCCWRWIV